MKHALLLLFFLLFLPLYGAYTYAQCENDDPTTEGIIPTLVAGNPALCAGGIRIDPPNAGTYLLFGSDSITISYTNTPCGQVFSWSVTSGVVIKQIVAKGGPEGANVYDYVGTGLEADSGLHSPLSGGTSYANVSHIDVCFEYKLTLLKTAETRFDRTFEWDIEKECLGNDTLRLAAGQPFNYPFSWTATVVDSADTGWNVSGKIYVINTTPFTVTIDSLTDEITGGFNVVPSCGVVFPYALLSGDTLECDYTQDLPNADSRTNTAIVYTSTANVSGDTATADVDFSEADVTYYETSIIVNDTCTDPDTVYASESPKTVNYTCLVGPYTAEECGEDTVINIASFITNDLALTGADTCSVIVIVDCETSCTLTPGYWKTHSGYGPAPYDDNWENILPDGEDTEFFLSLQTYYQVLWTSPSGGNVYYILAHAYIAAELNQLNGASIPADVLTAFNSATTFFTNYTPAQAGALKGAARNAYITLAQILDDYNNGITGPGHCSEEGNNSAGKAGDPDSDTETTQTQVEIPEVYSLSQNYPNPFNPTTTISFGLPEAGFVTLKVYDLLGKEVATLVNGNIQAGMHNVSFDASKIPSGVYLYKLQSGSFIQTKKMILMK